MKRSKKEWLLVVFFIWATLKSAGNLYGYEGVTDYAMFSYMNVAWAFFLINGLILVAELSTAIFLVFRNSNFFVSGIIVAVLSSINAIIVTVIGVRNIDLIRETYAASRAARGMTINPEQLDTVMSQQTLVLMLVAYIAFYVGLVWVMRRVKSELSRNQHTSIS